ncbi:MAG: small subunit ribosomal protein S19 [Candidatus Woesearchaeota archaeon]|jgi:small subunit ribosomal protein S19
MVKKVFLYRGMEIAELQTLSLSELGDIFTADVRRKIKRGFTEAEKKFLSDITTGNNVKTHCRDMLILPLMVDKTVKVHVGNSFQDVIIQPAMVGHRLGEYALSRKRVRHGSAGVGASRSGANQARK